MPIRCHHQPPDVDRSDRDGGNRLTNGNKTEAVALAMRRLLDQQERKGSLFGIMRGSVRVREGVDLTDPMDLSGSLMPRAAKRSIVERR